MATQHNYKVEFNNQAKFTVIAGNLDEVHVKTVNHIEKNNLSSCKIICPNGSIRRVRKTGAYHWNHNGYEFD